MSKQKLMSGMRPTGKLHLGHYEGVLSNWKNLQEDYDCYFEIADWHALTTNYDKTENLKQNVFDVVLDWLSCGINPEKSTIYLQSLVPQIAELHVLLSMITPQNWVEKDPTLKDMAKILHSKEGWGANINYGLLGYPILMSADIMVFNSELVPVGADQVAHIEITRDIIRRFNNLYNTDFFKEPAPKLTEIPMLIGVDGQKMGKSFNNDIKIADDEETTTKKIMRCITDTSRIKKDDLGHTDNCQVAYKYYEFFGNDELKNVVKSECESAKRGCADCKRQLASIINDKFREIRERRKELAANPKYVHEIVMAGTEKAKQEAELVMKQVRDIMKVSF